MACEGGGGRHEVKRACRLFSGMSMAAPNEMVRNILIFMYLADGSVDILAAWLPGYLGIFPVGSVCYILYTATWDLGRVGCRRCLLHYPIWVVIHSTLKLQLVELHSTLPDCQTA